MACCHLPLFLGSMFKTRFQDPSETTKEELLQAFNIHSSKIRLQKEGWSVILVKMYLYCSSHLFYSQNLFVSPSHTYRILTIHDGGIWKYLSSKMQNGSKRKNLSVLWSVSPKHSETLHLEWGLYHHSGPVQQGVVGTSWPEVQATLSSPQTLHSLGQRPVICILRSVMYFAWLSLFKAAAPSLK